MQTILDAIEQVGGIYVVTADHGNAEDMVKRDKSGKPALDKEGNLQILTSHTLKPVSSSTTKTVRVMTIATEHRLSMRGCNTRSGWCILYEIWT